MAGEWHTLRLGNVCRKIGSGATPRGGSNVYLDSGDVALIRSQNIYNDGFHRDGLVYLTEQHAAELANVQVEEDDVLLNITGDSVARSCQVAPDVLPARVNQHVAIVRPDPEILSPRFLRYYLVSPSMQAQMLGLAAVGATRNALTKGMIESFEVSAPVDVEDQHAIAHILGTLDDKIELNRRMNETLEAIARVIFKSWFVDFDPVRAKASGEAPEAICRRLGLTPDLLALFPVRLVDSELGEIPEGWETRKVEKLLSRLSTKVRYTKDEVKPYGAIPVFEQGAGILLGYHDGKAQFEASSVDPAFIFGDHTCVTHLACEPFDISQNVIPLKGSDRPTLWAFYAVRDKQVFQEYRRHWMELIAKDVVVSPERLCGAFTELMTPMHLRMEANVRQNHNLAEIRDALLPKLLSGDLRVPVAGAT